MRVDVDDRAASSLHENRQMCLQFQTAQGTALLLSTSRVPVCFVATLTSLATAATTYCQCEEASYASCFGQHAVCMLTPCGSYVRSQEKLMNVSITINSRVEVSDTVLIFDCHALHHGILFVHVDPLWEAADQVHYHPTRLALASIF